MNDTDRLLLDIGNRMATGEHIHLLLSQLKNIQQSLNTCAILLIIIACILIGFLAKM
jgi:hypothetical protein